MHTACVVGKNYRLQDIQLSKSFRCAIPGAARQARTLRLVFPLLSRAPLSARQSSTVRLPETACPATAASCFEAAKAGGEYRSRTGDLLVANQALSQLS